MDITIEEIKDFGHKWFEAVKRGSAEEQAAFFLNPNTGIILETTGAIIGFQDHAKLHGQWINEIHVMGNFQILNLNDSPSRVRATGTVYWQAEYKNQSPPNLIKCIVGEDWIVERVASGELKFVLYINVFHHFLPDSAPLKNLQL